MNKKIYFIILLSTCRICDAQNLITNGDFEQYLSCPTGISQLLTCQFLMSPNLGTPDYYNQCAPLSSSASIPQNYVGFQQTHSGMGYTGIILLNFQSTTREYIEIPLNFPLTANICYHFEMYVALSNISKYATDDIGVYFSDTAITGMSFYSELPFTPQINNTTGFITDTLNWTLVSGNYVAQGGEGVLIIGNFKDNANTNTILVDNLASLSMVYVYIDDLTLTVCTGIDEQNNHSEIKIYPNPFNDILYFTADNNVFSEVILYDITSRKLMQQTFTNSVSLNTEHLGKGIYLYEVRNKDGSCKKGKVVKD